MGIEGYEAYEKGDAVFAPLMSGFMNSVCWEFYRQCSQEAWEKAQLNCRLELI